MTAEQILQEIDKLPLSEQHQLSIEVAKQISDLRWLLLTHPDQEMVERSCLHFLGDAAQEWHAGFKSKHYVEYGS
jgi:hypothetical protein